MAPEFLRAWFGRPAGNPPDVADAVADLDRFARECPSLAGPATLLADLLPGLFGAAEAGAIPAVPAERAAARLAGGIPVLRGEPFTPDGRPLRRRWLHACTTLRRHREDGGPAALEAALRDGRFDPAAWGADVLAGRPEQVLARAEALGLDPGLAATVLRWALLPALEPAARNVLPEGCRWDHGYCPACGSWPLLGELRGLEQLRFLRCGLCAAGWEFPRLRCPFCGTADHQALGYFHVEGEEGRHRAATCDHCRRYVKAVATLGPLTAPRLLAADVMTLHLDLAAAERGYTS